MHRKLLKAAQREKDRLEALQESLEAQQQEIEEQRAEITSFLWCKSCSTHRDSSDDHDSRLFSTREKIIFEVIEDEIRKQRQEREELVKARRELDDLAASELMKLNLMRDFVVPSPLRTESLVNGC